MSEYIARKKREIDATIAFNVVMGAGTKELEEEKAFYVYVEDLQSRVALMEIKSS